MAVITADSLHKSYRVGDVEVAAIRGASFAVEKGAFAAFVGPSGSGKSTLLNMIGCLDRPSSGRLKVLDAEVGALSRRAAAHFRGCHIGFVFQDFNLIPVLSAWENVEYPLLMVQSWPEARRRARVAELLEAVGMADQAGKRPDQLSGGQKQRVAVARALATEAEIVLADEPTANLDGETARRVIALMRSMRDASGVTFLFSTHDPRVIGAADVIYRMEDGEVRTEAVSPTPGTETAHV